MRTLLALVLGIGLIAGLASGEAEHLFHKPSVFLFAFLLAPALLVALLWTRTGRPCVRRLRRDTPQWILGGCLLLALMSSFPSHHWFYFLRWLPDAAGFHKSDLVRLIFWTSLLTPLFVCRLKKPGMALVLVFVVGQVLCVQSLLEETGGAALYRTDHPSFMFRLFEFSRTFPQLVNYNPYWNGGTLHYVGVTSGTAAPGLLLFPLWRWLPIHAGYTYGVGFLFIVLIPWIAAGSIRAMGGNRTAMATAGILALGVSQHFFIWMLHFGTIGSAVAGAMILPVAALSFRIVWLRRREAWTLGLLVGAAFFLLLWPPGAIMGLGVAVAFLVNARRWTRTTWTVLLGCALAVLVLYSPWLFVQFNDAASVVTYAAKSGAGRSGSGAWLAAVTSGIKDLLAHLREGHPLLIFLGVAGAAGAPWRSVRRWFTPILLTLAVVTAWGETWLPQSQLSRLSIPLFFVAVAPAALWIGRVLRTPDVRLSVPRALLTVLLALGAYNVSRIYANKGGAPYVVMDDQVETVVGWVRRHTPEGGRVLFAGRCLHTFGRGNVAYLPVLTGREMMADDYYGFPPGTIEYNYPPKRFRKSFALMKTFFDAYNVTHIMTYHDNWKDYFRARPETFTELESMPSHHLTITLFAVNRPSRPLLQGSGSVRARFNRIDVALDAPHDTVVLSYNWMEGLTSTEDIELFPYTVDEEIVLIGVRPGQARRFSIVYRRGF